MNASQRPSQHGQILPLFAVALALLMLGALFVFNVLMFQTSATTQLDGALRSAGLGALASRTVSNTGADAGSTVWALNPKVAYATAKTLAQENLNEIQNILAEPWVSQPIVGSGDGLDVELIVPCMDAQAACGIGTSTVNLTPVDIQPVPGIGDPVPSKIATGERFTMTTVVLRIRVHVLQAGGGSMQIERAIVVKAGTSGN